MSKLFNTYRDIYSYDGELLITANSDYILPEDSSLKNISEISGYDINNMKHSMEFIDNNSDCLLYLVFRMSLMDNKIKNVTYIFKKNKLYNFEKKSAWYDEIGNIINSYNDIWYDPFLFVKVKDKENAMRYFKLNKIKNNI